MDLVIDISDELRSVTVDSMRGLTDSDLVELCQRYEDFRLEISAGGELIIMPPAYSEHGF